MLSLHAEFRRQEIIRMLSTESIMKVEDIIKCFEETPATIRRDLAYLEKTGAIMRTHGAAKIVNPFPTRNVMFSAEKMSIAKYTAKMVADNSSIIMDSGTTTLSLANQLVNREHLTVITNSLAIANTFALTDITTIVTGGVLIGKQQTFVGPDAEEFLSKVQASTIFLATTGIDPENGLTCISPFTASIKKAMIRAAKHVVLLCDSSKYSIPGLLLFARFDQIHQMVVARPIEDKRLLANIQNAGVEILVAESKGR